MRALWMIAAIMAVPMTAWADGDPAAGKTVFAKCGICHSVKEGENKIGPSLYGVVGRKSHSEPGYTYSEAMKAYDVTWDPETLNHYLVDPRKVVVGTKMIFLGLKSDEDRANVIAYLETLK
jgi:cytochrome c